MACLGILVAILLVSGVCIFVEILPPFPGNSKSRHIIHTKLTHGETLRDPNVPINWEKVSNSFYSVEYDPLHPSKLFLNAKAVASCGIGNILQRYWTVRSFAFWFNKEFQLKIDKSICHYVGMWECDVQERNGTFLWVLFSVLCAPELTQKRTLNVDYFWYSPSTLSDLTVVWWIFTIYALQFNASNSPRADSSLGEYTKYVGELINDQDAILKCWRVPFWGGNWFRCSKKALSCWRVSRSTPFLVAFYA